MAEPYKHIYKVDLDQPLKRFDVGDILASGDEKANRFEVTVCRDGANVDLSGCTVLAYFIRPNDETMTVDGTANGSKAIVEPSKNCYVYDGEFSLAIKLVGSGITQTVAVFDGRIVRTTSENIVDGDRVIYGLEDLLAQIAATEAAANNANTAAGKANTATQNANTATSNANTAASNANNATSAANSAADRANAAASNWENGIAANASKLGGKAPEYYIQPVNFLDNSYWAIKEDIVNQREIESYSASAQNTIDRWKTTNANTTVDIVDGALRITNSVSNSAGYLVQVVRNGERLLGKKLTLAIQTTGGKITCASTASTLPAEFPSATTLYATVSDNGVAIGDILLSTSYVQVRIYSNASETTRDFMWAALYEGGYTTDTLPPYVPKGYTAELAECKRYVVPLRGDLVNSYVATANLLFFLIPQGSTFYDGSGDLPDIVGTLEVKNPSAAVQSGFTIEAYNVAPCGVVIRATKTAHGLSSGYLSAPTHTLLANEL